MKDRTGKISGFTVASIYIGTIIGAGFASGREIWQYFGVFGLKGILGLVLTGIMFMILGMMLCYIGRVKDTDDIGRIILPFNNKTAEEILGYLVAMVIYVALITMSAAGGAFVEQQFGIHKAIGGLVIVIMVIFTVLGNFHRIAGIFNYLMPILVSVVVVTTAVVIFSPMDNSVSNRIITPSPMAPQWTFASLVYLAYNNIGTIPILAKAGINAKSMKQALVGAALGGVILFCMALALLLAMEKDSGFADGLDLPMLGFSSRIGRGVNIVYGIVLFFSIYSAATSTFYGVTTKIKEGRWKQPLIIFLALAGFALGLIGFRKIVALIFPIVGVVGFFIIIMLIFNFIRVYRNK